MEQIQLYFIIPSRLNSAPKQIEIWYSLLDDKYFADFHKLETSNASAAIKRCKKLKAKYGKVYHHTLDFQQVLIFELQLIIVFRKYYSHNNQLNNFAFKNPARLLLNFIFTFMHYENLLDFIQFLYCLCFRSASNDRQQAGANFF